MRPNLITRLKEEWNNLDPVDPLRGLIADAIDALAEQPAQQHELPTCISCGAAPTRYVDEGTDFPGTYCDSCGPGGVPAQQEPDYKALYEKAAQQYNELATLMEQPAQQQEGDK